MTRSLTPGLMGADRVVTSGEVMRTAAENLLIIGGMSNIIVAVLHIPSSLLASLRTAILERLPILFKTVMR